MTPVPDEDVVWFDCPGGGRLLGVLHGARHESEIGVVVVVGGPQYRVGSHRQFVHLARDLAGDGVPTLRFDHRGIGDSDWGWPDRPPIGFTESAVDVAAALDALVGRAPSVRRIVLWGLCDAASAILLHAARDPRVAGVVLLNPWVRTDAVHARTILRRHYRPRLFDLGFWARLARGRVDLRTALRGAGRVARGLWPPWRDREDGSDLPERMAEGAERFDGHIAIVLSGRDLTAQEFEEAARTSSTWRRLLASDHVRVHRVPAANHTFSRRDWRDEVSRVTRDLVARVARDPDQRADGASYRMR